jgi:flagellar hook-basal body complex protein FliE
MRSAPLARGSSTSSYRPTHHGNRIEVTKAGIQTKLMVNVKDKVMEAFYEIWRMSV